MVSQAEKIATKSFNYWVEEAGGNCVEARKLFKAWREETSPFITPDAVHTWTMLCVCIDWLFQEALRPRVCS
jgi:hypothetical protein